MKIFDDAIAADYFAVIRKTVTGRGVSRRIRSTGEQPIAGDYEHVPCHARFIVMKKRILKSIRNY